MINKMTLLLPLLVATSAFAATPTKDATGGFDVVTCNFDEEGGGFNFCTNRAYATYAKLGSSKNINFNQKYVLINFKNPIPGNSGAYTHSYAAIDTSNKKVFPFPFTVRDENLSKNLKVSVSRKTNTLCMPASYNADGNQYTTSYGGKSANKKMCFDFSPGSVNNFITEPTYK